MNLENNLAFFINQGPVFWAASASVGAGGTLLITALYVYLRRFTQRISLKRKNTVSNVPKAMTNSSKAEIQVTETGYTVASPGLKTPVDSVEAGPSMEDLLHRLKSLGDRLEDSLNPSFNAENPYSALKTRQDSVDYESRVGIG